MPKDGVNTCYFFWKEGYVVLASTLVLKLFSLDDLMGRFIEQSEDVELFLAALGGKKKKKKDFSIVWKIPNISYRSSWVRMALF